MLTLLVLITILAAVTAQTVKAATHYPTTRAARQWHPPAWWLLEAACIHRHESAGLGWHINHVDWRGRRSAYAGGVQFLDSTWRSAGGTGSAWQWSPREQLYRAYIVWHRDGHRWSEWGTAGACGLR